VYAPTIYQRWIEEGEKGVSPPPDRSSLASRLPRRSVRQVFAVPLSGGDQLSIPRNDQSSFNHRPLWNDGLQVDVAAIPSADRNCRHHLFVEDGPRLKKLDLPSTTCVTVSQRFEARAGDTLSFDYVIFLHSKSGFAADRPAVRAILVNRGAELAISLMDRSIDGCSATHQLPACSRFRESKSFTVPAAGNYELRFITLVDRNHPGSEAHLLVNSVRLVDPSGQEVKRLASLSSVGRVHQPTLDESIN
jgi:hypothetical protein